MADPFTIMMLVGTGISAVGTIATGQAQARAAEYQAKVLELNAKNERAAAQRDAMEFRHNEKLAQSNLQNNASASGFDPSDAGTADLRGDIAAHGELQAQMAQYGGDNAAEGLKAEAAAARARGQAAKTGSYFSAAGTLMSGFGNTLYDRYGYGAPKPAGTGGSANYGLVGRVFGF